MRENKPCIVAQRIRERRKCAAISMTQEELADKSGLSVKTINKIEHMVAPTLTVDTFVRLCAALDCSADYLLGIDELPHHEATDIQRLTGLSEAAIEELIRRNTMPDNMDGPEPFQGRSSDDNLEVVYFIDHLINNINEELLVHCILNAANRRLCEWEEEEIEEDILEEFRDEEGYIETEELVRVRNKIKYYEGQTAVAEWNLNHWFTTILKDYLRIREDEAAESIEEWQQIHDDEDWWKWGRVL